jgi:hypothetical protein
MTCYEDSFTLLLNNYLLGNKTTKSWIQDPLKEWISKFLQNESSLK